MYFSICQILELTCGGKGWGKKGKAEEKKKVQILWLERAEQNLKWLREDLLCKVLGCSSSHIWNHIWPHKKYGFSVSKICTLKKNMELWIYFLYNIQSLRSHFKKLFIAESTARVCMCLSITVITRALDLMKDLSELLKLLTLFFCISG